MVTLLCDFTGKQKGDRCTRCGWELPFDTKHLPKRPCNPDGEPPRPVLLPQEPGKIQMAWNYGKAVTKWKLAGSPKRSPERVLTILNDICETCTHFVPGERPHCGLCGCSLNDLPDGLDNKIAMATESCPAKPPKWTADVDGPS